MIHTKRRTPGEVRLLLAGWCRIEKKSVFNDTDVIVVSAVGRLADGHTVGQIEEFIKDRLHRGNAVCLPGIGTAENQAGIYIAALSTIECMNDTETLAPFLVGAFFQAAGGAVQINAQVPFTDPLNIFFDGSPRQAGGAHDQTDIFLAAIEIALLESRFRVALLGADETACHLYPVCPLTQRMFDILAIPDTAGGDDRNMQIMFVSEISFDSAHRCILVIGSGADIFDFFSEMAPRGVGVFDHDSVRQAVEPFFPLAGDQLSGFDRGDNGNQRHIGKINGESRQVQRQACAADDELGARFAGDAHLLLIIGNGHHAVGADHPVRRNFIGETDLVAQRLLVGGKVVLATVVRTVQADAGSGDNADSSAKGDMPGETPAGYPDPHAALQQGKGNTVFADGQAFVHCESLQIRVKIEFLTA